MSLRKGWARGALGVLLLTSALAGLAYWRQSPTRGLPYRDRFSAGTAEEWKAMGGTWELSGGMMRNESDERGAKLMTGSRFWHNYSVEADVYLLGPTGDAGLVIRSGNEEEGVNAYSGYYAGVRTADNSLVLGRAEHGWMEITRPLVPAGSVRAFQWYHLKLMAYECHIVASVSSSPRVGRTMLEIHDPDCIATGRIGLRSYSSGGIWRNVQVRSASRQDLAALLGEGGSDAASQSRMTQNLPSGESGPLVAEQRELIPTPANTRSIASLLFASSAHPEVASIRGVVVLTQPRLYVQDSTGGVYVPNPRAPLLKVGDEVEVTGEVHPGDYSSMMEDAAVRVLWARTPVPPVAVTVSQASTGHYDATFIEIRGHLSGKEHGPADTLVLNMDEGPQSFRAILNPGRSDALFGQLKPNSTLRLRGICVVDPSLTNDLTPFVLLLRSNEDLEMIAGPPWWNPGHVIALCLAALLLALIGVVLHHRVENWRLHAILEERGRLAHEMHDTLAQSFAGIGFQLQAIRNSLPTELTELQQQLELASNLVRHSHEEARRSIASLRTEKLESRDILLVLQISAQRMVEGGSVQVIAERQGDSRPLPLRTADSLFRIGQEAIANAVRHAAPTEIRIRLTWLENAVRLEVEDNGTGFVTGNHLLGFGIRGMRRRAQSASAVLRIDSAPQRGTRVIAEAALPPRHTLFTWPKLLWQHAVEYWINARTARTVGSHSYRG